MRSPPLKTGDRARIKEGYSGGYGVVRSGNIAVVRTGWRRDVATIVDRVGEHQVSWNFMRGQLRKEPKDPS